MFCGRLDDAGHAVVWDCTVNVSFVSVSVRVRCSVTRDLLHSGQTVVADMPACCLSCAQFSYQLAVTRLDVTELLVALPARELGHHTHTPV